jgi:excisionase family DNA binding protein
MNQPTITPEDELLSPPQAAKLLGVVPLTVRIWVLRGKLAGRDIGGGRMLIRRADVDAYLSETAKVPAA